jgi:hypothetical protein
MIKNLEPSLHELSLLMQGLDMLEHQTEINSRIFCEMDLPGTHNLKLRSFIKKKRNIENLKDKLVLLTG